MMNRRIQTFFILLVILFTTGCGSGSNKAKKAQVKITNFTTTNSENPTIEDYEVTGFSAINESNINRVNKLLREMPSDEVDTFKEIKVFIDELLDNKKPPIITIIGVTSISLKKDAIYQDLGAKASDDRDGNITEYINIVSDVNSSKTGEYTVTYSVNDSAGNKDVATRKVQVTPDSNSTVTPDNNVTKLILEDAEDGKTNGWIVEYDHGEDKAEIINKQDDETNSRVIYLDGNNINVGFLLGGSWNDTKSKVAQWSMKTDEKFLVRFIIETANGERFLEYNNKDTGTGKFVSSYNNKHYIRHGIGTESVDGKWHTYTRDIEQDLKRYEPNNKLMKIKGIHVEGNVSLDDIIFYHSSENLSIEKSVVVSAPGVVLTFDDSYVDNWHQVMPYFEEKDVVATFFCHKWASTQTGDLTEAELATLRLFEVDGHEIGYHTKDHVSTRDKKYNKNTTIEAKANAYFEYQIKPGVENMRTRGFEPESFSYPYVSGQVLHNRIIKETLPHIREFFAHVYGMDAKPAGGARTLEEIKGFLYTFKENKEIGVLVGHWIYQDGEGEEKSHKVPIEKLKAIIEYASKIGLKFYTLKEAHNIYLNQ